MLHNKTYIDLSLSLEQINKGEVILLIPIITALVIISVIGLPGNGLVCYVYGVKSAITTSSRWFIFFLGCTNFVQCVIVVPGEIITIFFQYNFTNIGACKATAFLNCSSLAVMVYTLLIVAIDRYRKVCRPHGWQIEFRSAKILTIVTVSLAILISAPSLWVYGVKSHILVVKGHNITVIFCGFSEAASNSPLTFYYILFGMTLTTVFLTTTCILYCFIGRDIRRQLCKEQSRRGATQTIHHGIPPRTSRKTIIEVFRLQTMKKMRNKAENTKVEIKIPKENNATTSATTTCEKEGALAYYHQSTGQIQPPKPLVRRRSNVRKATFSLFLISLAFVLSYLPTLLLLLIRSTDSEFEASLNDADRVIYKFFLRICWLYCALNPFLLAMSDARFRTQCRDILSQGWKRLTCQT